MIPGNSHQPISNPNLRSLQLVASLAQLPHIINRNTPTYHSLNSADGWKTVKSKFLTYFNPIGSTKEQQIKAWKELKWKPEEQNLTDFVFRFSQLVHELGYSDEQ